MAQKHLATLCTCVGNPGCPQVLLDDTNKDTQEVIIKDDFGHAVYMSKGQFRDLVQKAKKGELDL